MAYDNASIRVRSRDSDRNFPWTNVTVHEPNFQSHSSTETILNMIREGSYLFKFVDYTFLEEAVFFKLYRDPFALIPPMI